MAASLTIVRASIILLGVSLCGVSLCACFLFSSCSYTTSPVQSILSTSVSLHSQLICPFSLCRAAVHATPSLPSLVSPTRLPSSLLPPLNPWRLCQKPTSPLGLTGWTDFARVCRCPAQPARISYDLQVKITAYQLDSRQLSLYLM